MKTENFDDAIKKKIESIDHGFGEKDIDRVLNYIGTNRAPAPVPPAPWRNFLFYGAAGLVITGFITWKITSMHDHAVLDRTVAELSKNHSKPEQTPQNNTAAGSVASSTTAPSASLSQGTDHNIPIQHGSTAGGGHNAIASLHRAANHRAGHAKQNLNVGTLLADKGQSRGSSTGNTSHNGNSSTNNDALSNNTQGNSTAVQNTGNTGNGIMLKGMGNEDVNAVNRMLQNPVVTEQQNTSTGTALTLNTDAGKAKDQQKDLDKIKQADTVNSLNGYRGPKNEKTESTPASFHLQANAGGFYGRRLMGAGISDEIIMNGAIGFSAGLQVTNFMPETFANDHDYFAKSNLDFRSTFIPDAAGNGSLENISIRSAVYQVPLMFTWHGPTQNGWGYSASLGTDLDLVANQSVSYTDKDNASAGTITVNNSRSAVLFNNLNLSGGVMKQLNSHWAIQAGLFLSPQLVNTQYRMEHLYYGGNVKLLFSLGKGGF